LARSSKVRFGSHFDISDLFEFSVVRFGEMVIRSGAISGGNSYVAFCLPTYAVYRDFLQRCAGPTRFTSASVLLIGESGTCDSNQFLLLLVLLLWSAPSGALWLHEVKHDGFPSDRPQAGLSGLALIGKLKARGE
jgi:hypothetical protein